jgi:hypothetical protein
MLYDDNPVPTVALFLHDNRFSQFCAAIYYSLILHPLQDSTPRVVKLGNSAVCCGGTHVSDISEIISLQVNGGCLKIFNVPYFCLAHFINVDWNHEFT